MYVFGMILNTYIQSLEQVGMVCFCGQQSAEESARTSRNGGRKATETMLGNLSMRTSL